MKKLVVPFLCLSLMACDKNSDSTPKEEEVQFEVSEVVSPEALDKVMSCYGSVPGTIGDMDSRLKAGLVYVEAVTSKEYEDKNIEPSSSETKTIESVDHDKNFFVSKNTFSSQKITGWILTKTQFNFSASGSGYNNEILDSSPSLKGLIASNQNANDSNEPYTNCRIKYDNSKIDGIVENGNYVFSDGRKVSAQRQTETITGTIECVKYQIQGKDEEVKELSRVDVGPGKEVRTEIYTKDVPSIDTCIGGIFKLFEHRELISEDKKTHDLYKSKYTRIKF